MCLSHNIQEEHAHHRHHAGLQDHIHMPVHRPSSYEQATMDAMHVQE